MGSCYPYPIRMPKPLKFDAFCFEEQKITISLALLMIALVIDHTKPLKAHMACTSSHKAIGLTVGKSRDKGLVDVSSPFQEKDHRDKGPLEVSSPFQEKTIGIKD